ncbi:MAG TPA: hypothetical protein VJU84_21515 [Pyrinomonadaceae bacterium]|nr:hypothetical protein [Pyrinomonadaceae bacterium]
MKNNRTHHCATLIGLLSFICFVALHVDAQTRSTNDTQLSFIRERIQRIMRETIDNGENVIIVNGHPVTARTFIPPSQLAVDEVKGYGEKAVPVLAEYLRQTSGFEKYHAMRLLGAIGGKSVVAPLRQVALHDYSGGYREYALAFLTQAPWELAAPILQEAASRDPDIKVRQRAKELLDGYAPR